MDDIKIIQMHITELKLRNQLKSGDLEVALTRAMSALEKQIPKKQGNLYKLGEHLNIDIDGFVVCHITHKDFRYPLISLRDLDYCPRCGQRLDWSEI